MPRGIRPEPTDPSAVVSGEGQAEQRKKWLSCPGQSCVGEESCPPCPAQAEPFPHRSCARAVSLPRYGITASHRFDFQFSLRYEFSSFKHRTEQDFRWGKPGPPASQILFWSPLTSFPPWSMALRHLLLCSPWNTHQALSLLATQTTASPCNTLH